MNQPPKYDDFGELVWREPKRVRRKKVDLLKLLGEALV